jgi:hypothetical protein
MVFCTADAAKYDKALDLIMVDPYPIPNGPAGSVQGALDNVIGLGKPVIMCPQAFGGGENWAREPSGREMRLMTYQGLMAGAVGIQVRRSPGILPLPTDRPFHSNIGRFT